MGSFIRKRVRRAEARPGEVLDAALDAFLEKGFAATRVEDIAARAGVSKGTVYLYFESKDAILRALVREHVVPIAERLAAMSDDQALPPSVLLPSLKELGVRLLSDPRVAAVPRLVITEAARFPDLADFYRREVIEVGMSAMERLIARGVASGEFRPVDAHLAVRSIFGAILLQVLFQGIFARPGDPEIAPDALLSSHLDILQNGLKPR